METTIWAGALKSRPTCRSCNSWKLARSDAVACTFLRRRSSGSTEDYLGTQALEIMKANDLSSVQVLSAFLCKCFLYTSH